MEFMFLYQPTRNRVSNALQVSTIICDGILKEDKTPENPFADVSFEEAVKEYTKRNYNRKKAQIARKKKKEEGEVKKELKRKLKKKEKSVKNRKHYKKKRRKVVKVKPKLEEEKEIIGAEAPNDLIPQSAPVSTEHKAECNILREKRCNIQQQTFNDRRASTEAFLNGLLQ